ncbi:hypothetical protein AB1Y20_023513 [Prymnesium parvum]
MRGLMPPLAFGATPSPAQAPLPLGDAQRVERLGFGTWAWGNKLLWDYDERNDAVLQAAFDRAVAPASLFDKRRFFFDTGDSYGTGALEGRAETLLGRFREESGRPERAVLGTKLAVYPTRWSGASFERACRASLDRLGVEQIALIQAHWSAANFQPWQEPALWDGLALCYEAGLAQACGTSNFGPEQLRKVNAYWTERGIPHASNQFQFSLLSTLPLESGLFDACSELGVTPIGYSPLALGLLSGKYSVTTVPRGPRGILFRQILPGLKPLLGTLKEIALTRGTSMSTIAINWCMCQGALVIVGVKTPAQAVADNLAALEFQLSVPEVDELTAMAARVPRKATQNIFQTS